MERLLISFSSVAAQPFALSSTNTAMTQETLRENCITFRFGQPVCALNWRNRAASRDDVLARHGGDDLALLGGGLTRGIEDVDAQDHTLEDSLTHGAAQGRPDAAALAQKGAPNRGLDPNPEIVARDPARKPTAINRQSRIIFH
ncbi:Oidioi.mRNA.OKI2018_I69.XSR.g14770.t1.cds [Oikopleura dioica]|uniref:Oidioi.mRNA.OKI2018_I69.XSR.g14770.t1.cds n=1 Tax=Oikopleura dioica TaxID=34765 RepID=A0ABN7SET2_OIKDI|nr:Oidioi.mRNA.OKI2018_I69.XSR.g14770.t1.cds [Oikopleura dioica]